jgi:hypothetical protein
MRLLLTGQLVLLAGCTNQELEMHRPCRGAGDGAVQNARVGGAALSHCRAAQDRQFGVKVRALLAERRQRIGYEGMLQAENRSCK